MVATNELLSMGFGIIASFTNAVQVPVDSVPTKKADLQRYVVGSPRSPVDLFLVHRDGTRFWVTDGAVTWFVRSSRPKPNWDPGRSAGRTNGTTSGRSFCPSTARAPVIQSER